MRIVDCDRLPTVLRHRDADRALLDDADSDPPVWAALIDPPPDLPTLQTEATAGVSGFARGDRAALRDLVRALRSRANIIERWLDETAGAAALAARKDA